MSSLSSISRRKFLESAAMAAAAGIASQSSRSFGLSADTRRSSVLNEFGYGDVSIDSPIHEEQLRQTHAVLMSLDEDSLMKPFRAMAGQPAPGKDLGGWYQYDPNNQDYLFEIGFAPGVTRDQLLAVKKTGAHSWQMETAGGAMTMLPWTEIGEEGYMTYLRVG